MVGHEVWRIGLTMRLAAMGSDKMLALTIRLGRADQEVIYKGPAMRLAVTGIKIALDTGGPAPKLSA